MNGRKNSKNAFADKALDKGMDFVSRFLDMTIADLSEFDEAQIKRMICDIAYQMPDEILQQFENELNGGKRDF